MDAWIAMGAVLVTLVVCVLYPSPRLHGAPRVIWTWNDTPYVTRPIDRACRASWKRTNPDHTIITLTQDTFQTYARVPAHVATHPVLAPFLKDMVRITVLSELGGIWLDSNIMLHGPLDPWLFSSPSCKQEKLMGFMQDGRIYTAFLAALPGCTWLRAWKESWYALMRYDSIQSYAAIKKKEGIPMDDLQNPLDHLNDITWRTLRAPTSFFLDQETMNTHMKAY